VKWTSSWENPRRSPPPLNCRVGLRILIYGPCEMTFEQINNSTGAVTYLHHDQAGSTRLITSSSGKVEGKCSYSAYGTPACEGTATTPLGYDGQYTSTDTGLVYLRNRVYDPVTAQFLTRDPLEAITGVPYAYADDNPLNYSDPSGAISLSTIVTVVVAGAADVGCGATVEVPGVDALTCGGAADADSAAAADIAGDEAASAVADTQARLTERTRVTRETPVARRAVALSGTTQRTRVRKESMRSGK
jgi:RHS repeat-associated protein